MHLVKFRTIQVGSIKNKWKFWCIIRYLHALKIPPQKNTSYRGIKDNFTVEKTNQVIRVMEEMNLEPLDGMNWQEQREHQPNSNWATVYEITGS